VELRAPDAQTDVDRVVSLAALAQCVVATADEHPPEDPLLTEENKWSAARHGLDARLHDFSTGKSTAARYAARNLVEMLRPVSQDLGCETELEGVLKIVEGGNGADKQRSVFGERGSTEDVVGYLVAKTA
jgi:carboxylate-amine ligase